MNEPDFILDIDGLQNNGSMDVQGTFTGRPWVGIRFDCCGVYQRIYRDAEGTMYAGQCPRCLRRVTLRVGSNGTNARFFMAE